MKLSAYHKGRGDTVEMRKLEGCSIPFPILPTMSR